MSIMDLLCEPDAPDASPGPPVALLLPSYCLPQTSCGYDSLGPPVAMTPLDLLWQCLLQASCGNASLGPPVAVPPSDLLWLCLPRTPCGCASLGPFVAVPPSDLRWLWLPRTKTHSRSRGTQQVQIHLCYLKRRVHTEVHFQTWYTPSGFYTCCTSKCIFQLAWNCNTPYHAYPSWINLPIFQIFHLPIREEKVIHDSMNKWGITVCKRNYQSPYGILLVKLPLVAVLFISINNDIVTMKN